MNNKAILRTQKLKHKASVRRSLKHAFREQDTPNADAQRTPSNSHLGAQSSAEVMQAFDDRLPDKVRKNAVLAIEYFIGGSPEALNGKSREQQDQYFSDALSWLRARHGEENVLYAGIHRDETTPHMYAYVVPIDPKGKLNCRHFLGGSKALSQMQTEFADSVGKQHGLERGIEGSKAKHQRIKDYYAQINQPDPNIELQERPKSLGGIFAEPEDEYRKRMELLLKHQLKPVFDKAKRTEMAEKREQEHKRTAEQARQQEKRWRQEVYKAKELVERLTNLTLDKLNLSRLITSVKMLGGKTDQELRQEMRQAQRGRDTGLER